jgi:predicted nucleic acid-binding Zn ribbon protein
MTQISANIFSRARRSINDSEINYMSFESINNLLGALQNQAEFQKIQQFRLLLRCWAETVGTAANSQTRPISISRDVLFVATSSSAWSNNLSLQRYRILKQLNAQLPMHLIDIRFSTAQWQDVVGQGNSLDERGQSFILQHPSWVGDAASLPSEDEPPTVTDAHTAFQNWAKRVRERSHFLPLCTQCHCPTPAGELQRWGVCSFCTSKQQRK